MRSIAKVFIRMVLPCLIVLAVIGLLIRGGREIAKIIELKNQTSQMDIKLVERRMDEYELRRKKIILDMDDFRSALLKANGAIPLDGEIRIRVK